MLPAALLASTLLHAQQKVDPRLRAFVDDHRGTGQLVDLLIRGDAPCIKAAIRRLGGRVKLGMKGIVSARLPIDAVERLGSSNCVTGFEFSTDRGRTLNDSSRYKSRVHLVQQGLAPLPMPYDGAGVLVGIIDTGSDFRHDDFKLPDGRTRVLKYWDHYCSTDTALVPDAFGYGQVFDSAMINAGTFPICPPNLDHQFGHGTTVMGTAASNGNATGRYIGAAPAADLIVVASKLSLPNWRATIADAVKFILDEADALGRPVAINISLGSYAGSHDGLDATALLIDSMLNAAPGRMLICAGGNGNQFPPYHLRHDVTADTAFTWFTSEANTPFGYAGVYFDLWADSADFAQVRFAVGADRTDPALLYRGRTPFRTALIDSLVRDTLWSLDGNRLGVVNYFAQRRGDQVNMQVYLLAPDSADHLYRFISTGQGRFDLWSGWNIIGLASDMVADVPDPVDYPDIVHYVLPDVRSGIVDAWACSPGVLTVGNYWNENEYLAANDSLVQSGTVEGGLNATSNHGPTRDGRIKPDLAAPGDLTLSAGPPAQLAAFLATQPWKLSNDSLHMRNGGTSIASPMVTGSVALLLQKCPGATPSDIIAAFTQNTASDAYTGVLPNDSFGYGKLDTYAALIASNFIPGPLTVLGDTVFCPGDSVAVEAPAGTTAWWWSNGDSTMIAYANDAGPLSVEVWNGGGCEAHSDTAWFTLHPAPAIPVISFNGSVLESTPADAYQWLLEGSAIIGATAQTWEPVVNGNYQVITTDANGCTALSDTLFVLNVGIADPGPPDLIVRPSPAHDRVQVMLGSTTAIARVEVMAADGTRVFEGVPGDGWIDVHALAPGTYQMRVLAADGLARMARFVKR